MNGKAALWQLFFPSVLPRPTLSFNQPPKGLSSRLGGKHPLPEVMVRSVESALSLFGNAFRTHFSP